MATSERTSHVGLLCCGWALRYKLLERMVLGFMRRPATSNPWPVARCACDARQESEASSTVHLADVCAAITHYGDSSNSCFRLRAEQKSVGDMLGRVLHCSG